MCLDENVISFVDCKSPDHIYFNTVDLIRQFIVLLNKRTKPYH